MGVVRQRMFVTDMLGLISVLVMGDLYKTGQRAFTYSHHQLGMNGTRLLNVLLVEPIRSRPRVDKTVHAY